MDNPLAFCPWVDGQGGASNARCQAVPFSPPDRSRGAEIRFGDFEQVVQLSAHVFGAGRQDGPPGHKNHPQAPGLFSGDRVRRRIRKEPGPNGFGPASPAKNAIAHSFAQQSLGPVALHGAADFPAGYHGAGFIGAVQQIHYEQSPYSFDASLVDRFEFRLFCQGPLLHGSGLDKAGESGGPGLNDSSGNALTALGPAPLEDQATRLGRHPLAEAVPMRALDILG